MFTCAILQLMSGYTFANVVANQNRYHKPAVTYLGAHRKDFASYRLVQALSYKPEGRGFETR
jgi:hypothetical protein